jgi:hypothetical protein
MNNPRSQNTSDAREISAVGEKAVNKRPFQMPGGRVNNESRRLIQNDERGILVEEGELYNFRLQVVGSGRRNRDGHSIRGLEPVTWLGLPVVNPDTSIPDQVLDF